MPKTRDTALDAVKGFMIVAMVLAHASALFVASRDFRVFLYPGVLAFVSGSWVFVAGFIVGTRYRMRFGADPAGVTRRLLSRGAKLMGIFIAANLLLGRIPLTCSLAEGLQACEPVRLLLRGPDDEHAFEIIFAIGYVLMLSPLFLRWPGPTALLTVLAILLATVASFFVVALPALVWMLACGTAGIVIAGLLRSPNASSLFADARQRRVAALLAAVVCGIYLWLRGAGLVNSVSAGFYVSYVVSSLVLLYVACAWVPKAGLMRRELDAMARYSLLCYLGQMAILQVLHRLVPGSGGAISYALAVITTLVILLTGLRVLDHLRRRHRLVDRAYRAVFD